MADHPHLYHIILLRHGKSTGNAQNILQGQCDYPLNETGILQAQALAKRWQREGISFDRIISSPLLRARQTAEIIASALQTSVEFNPDWIERDYGLSSGLDETEAQRRYPTPPFTTPYTPFGETGESRWDVYLRAGRAIQQLLRYPPGRYLVVAHGGVLNMAMYVILGIPPQAHRSGARFALHNTGFTALTYHPGDHTWRLLSFNDHAHWPESIGQHAGTTSASLEQTSPIQPGSWKVRPALSSDIPQVAEIFIEADELHIQALPGVYRMPDDLQAIRQAYLADLLANPDNRLFVAEADGQLVGAAITVLRDAPPSPLHTPRRFVVVDTLSVRRAYRRLGVGWALMEAIHAWAKERGASTVELTVWEFNASALAFYHQLGYRTANRRMWIDL